MSRSSKKEVNPAAQNQDDALFQVLEQQKKEKRRRVVRTIIFIVILALIVGFFGVRELRKTVDDKIKKDDSNVMSSLVKRGSVSTTVSGYGTLANVDEEKIEIPAGVEIVEVTVEANNIVAEGDVIAEIEPASVLDAMTTVQKSISEVDEKLRDANDEGSTKYVQSFVSGRVKKIYAEIGETVADCMYDHAALALLSLDGYMACDLETDALEPGDSVVVSYGDGRSERGSVERVINEKATVIISDAIAPYGAKAVVSDAEGKVIGESVLYIHSPLRVTAVAGTVYSMNVKENDSVSNGSCILSLKNTEYAATFDYLIKQRGQLEEDLFTLNKLYRDGAVRAPYAGTVVSVDYDKDASKTTTTVTYFDDHSTASTVDKSKDAIKIVTLSPDIQMKTTVSIDEANILALELGQIADVTIDSIGEDVFEGTVTEINKTLNSSKNQSSSGSGSSGSGSSGNFSSLMSSNTGVTKYSAVVTLDKTEQMLAGMTANVVVRIQGIDNALIIPVDALHQTSTTSFVYTSYNRETQEFGGLTEVETGISNSSYVEIISGLEEGTEIYYEKKEVDPFSMYRF